MNEHLYLLCLILALVIFGGPVAVVQQRLRWRDYLAISAPRSEPRNRVLLELLFFIWSRSHRAIEDRFLSRWVVAARLGSLAGPAIIYVATRAMIGEG